MTHPLLSLTALLATTTMVAFPAATASRPAQSDARAAVAVAGERVVIGPDGADMREIERGGDGLFYVHARVNGARVRFLIDTGATDIVLTPKDAARIGIAPKAGRYGARMSTAGGRVGMAWTRLDQVEVAGRTLTDMRAAVMRGGLDVSLLGQNLLSHFDRLTIEGDTLRMR